LIGGSAGAPIPTGAFFILSMVLLADTPERCSPIFFLASVVPVLVLAATTIGVAAVG
jgi:hypothetical protein